MIDDIKIMNCPKRKKAKHFVYVNPLTEKITLTCSECGFMLPDLSALHNN